MKTTKSNLKINKTNKSDKTNDTDIVRIFEN